MEPIKPVIYFCDNPKCPRHYDIPLEIERAGGITEEGNGKRVQINRVLYRFIKGAHGTTLHLCSVCDGVVKLFEMLKGE